MCCLFISVSHSSQNQVPPTMGVPVPTITDLRNHPNLIPLREWADLCRPSSNVIVAVIGVARYSMPCSEQQEKLSEMVDRKLKEKNEFINNIGNFQGDLTRELKKYINYINIDDWSRKNDGIQEDLSLRKRYKQCLLKRSDVENRWKAIRDASGGPLQDNAKVYEMLLSEKFKSVAWAEDGYGHTALFCIGRLNDQQQSMNISKIHVAKSQGIANKVYSILNQPVTAGTNMANTIDTWARGDGTVEDNELRKAFIKGHLTKQAVQIRKNIINQTFNNIATASADVQNCSRTYNFLLSTTFDNSDWDSHLMVQKPEDVPLSSKTCDSYTIIPATAIIITKQNYQSVCERILRAATAGGRIIETYYELGKWGHNCDDAIEALLKDIVSPEDLKRIRSSSFARIPLYRLRLSDPERGFWDSLFDRSKDVSLCCVNKTSQFATCGYVRCW